MRFSQAFKVFSASDCLCLASSNTVESDGIGGEAEKAVMNIKHKEIQGKTPFKNIDRSSVQKFTT
jgi:hypothetical protein